MKCDEMEILHEILRTNAFIVNNLYSTKMHLYGSSLTVVLCDTFPAQKFYMIMRGLCTAAFLLKRSSITYKKFGENKVLDKSCVFWT